MCRCHECENTFIGYKRRVTCKACANKHPEQAEGAQGEREVTPNPSCSMCSGNGYFCEFSTVETCWCCLPDPEPEETVEALKERIESLKAGVTHMKQQRDAAVARAALAQPSPAPELERPEVAVKVLISPDMKHIFVPSLPDDQQPRVADFMAHWMVHWVELAPAPAEFQCQIDDLSKRYANTLCELNRMPSPVEQQEVKVEITRHESRIDLITPILSPRLQAKKTKVNDWFIPSSWNSKWANIQRRAEIRARRPYQTRHTYACWCLAARGNLAFIAKQMGHKDFTMLVKVYAAWMDDESPNELQHIWQGMQNQA